MRRRGGPLDGVDGAPADGPGSGGGSEKGMGCTRCRRVVFLWIDRERESLPVEPLARHLQECPECRDHAVRVERLVLMLRTRCRRTSAPGHLASRIRGLLEFD